MEISPIDLREIDKRCANVYEAIIVSAKRARQINDENKMAFNAIVGTMPPTNTDDDSEDILNPAQLKVSLEFEKKDKPHVEALHEVLEKGVPYEYKQQPQTGF